MCYLDSVPGLVESDYKNLYRVNVSPKGHSSGESVKQKYLGQLSREDMEQFYERYKIDFELHGYDLKDYYKYASDG